MNGGEIESSSRIKNGNWSLPVGENEEKRSWRDYLENLCDSKTQEQIVVHMCGFGGRQRGNILEESRLGGLKQQ